MPKQSSYPLLLDEVHKFNLSLITSNGELKTEQVRTGTITWTNTFRDQKSSISYTLNTYGGDPSISLNYNYNGQDISYSIELVSVPSNLGKGEVWYFLCPVTLRRCRNLYLANGYFLHREAVEGGMYQVQTFSKTSREIIKMIDASYKAEELYFILNSKNFKRTYAGKPTKRYLRIMAKLRELNSRW